jgi:hypothetical protein
VSWLLEVTIGVMLDARSRRAVEETLLDWSHEANQTQGALAAALCHARGVLAIGRTMSAIVLHEVAELPRTTVWLRATLWLIAPYVFFQISFPPYLPAGASATTHLTTSLLLFPEPELLAGPWTKPESDRTFETVLSSPDVRRDHDPGRGPS